MKILILSTLFSLSSLAHESEVLVMPKGGQSMLEVGVRQITATTIDSKTPGESIDVTGSSYLLNYQYGLNDNLAIGGLISQSETVSKLKPSNFEFDSRGLTDLSLFMMAKSEPFYFGGRVSIPVEASYSDGQEANQSSGGNTISPFAAVLLKNESINYGAIAEYQLKLERKSENRTTLTTSTTTGGNILNFAPFVEWNYGSGYVAFYYQYSSIASEESDDGTTVTKSDSRNNSTLSLTGTFDISESTTAIANYSVLQEPSSDSAKAYSLPAASISMRFRF